MKALLVLKTFIMKALKVYKHGISKSIRFKYFAANDPKAKRTFLQKGLVSKINKVLNVKQLTVLFLILLLPTASYTEVILQSPFTDNVEFQIYVSLKSNRESLSQKIFKTHPRPWERKQMRLKFAEAMKLYLSGQVEDAQSKFRSFVSHSKDADWGKGDRELFFNAYMRLAQLSKDQTEIQRWIQDAIRYDVEKRPSEKMYPPPLQKLFLSLHEIEKKEFIMWSPTSFFRSYDYIIINGKRYSTNNLNTVTLPRGRHRISAVSNKYGYWSKVLDRKKILNFSKDLPPALVQGNCHKPQILDNPWTIPSHSKAFFGRKCIKTNIENLTKQNQIPLMEDKNPQSKMKSETLWIIIGASLFAGYFILRKDHKSNHEIEVLKF